MRHNRHPPSSGGGRTIVIGDIHGCRRTFDRLLFDRLAVTPTDTVILLGDLIDRGPDSKGVLDMVMALQERGYTMASVRGNHEQMLLDFYAAGDPSWLSNGAGTTLASFAISDAPCNLPPHYLAWIGSLPHYLICGDYLIVHAGIDTDIADPFADLEAMLWTRRRDIDPAKIGNRTVIAGHTPRPLDDIRRSLASGSPLILLDGGCVYRDTRPELGFLCALVIETRELVVQKNIEPDNGDGKSDGDKAAPGPRTI
ncbi:MAG: serine/threonine protein phosphatase [Deltaproteobacteria bacterium]|nr:serine/threonine protein phosphatase [Candidatus Anaeroferrophillacea bacterium]